MSEELNPTFKKCMVKKSKYYFKEIWGFIFASAFVVVICAFIAIGIVWGSENITSEGVILFLVYLSIVSLIAILLALPNLTFINFLKNIVNSHILCIAVICVIVMIISCYASASFGVASLIVYLLQTNNMFANWILAILWLLIFAIICPINFALGDCLKCHMYTKLLFDKIMSYELM